MNDNQLNDDNKDISENKSKHIDTNSDITSHFPQNDEIAKTIPLFAENFDVTKKTEETQLVLAKKWIDSTKKIEIPIKYEEILINGKEFDSYNQKEVTEILSKIKDKITHVFSHEKSKENEDKESGGDRYSQHNSIASPSDIEIREYDEQSPDEDEATKNQNNAYISRKSVPLSIIGEKNNISNKEKDNIIIIPLWGEEIIINKRMVKLGEIVVRKYEGIEKKKIDVDIKTEKLTIRYPDKHKEEII